MLAVLLVLLKPTQMCNKMLPSASKWRIHVRFINPLLFVSAIASYYVFSVLLTNTTNEEFDSTANTIRNNCTKKCTILIAFLRFCLWSLATRWQPNQNTERLSSFTECAGNGNARKSKELNAHYSHLSSWMFRPAWFPSIRTLHRSQLVACVRHW